MHELLHRFPKRNRRSAVNMMQSYFSQMNGKYAKVKKAEFSIQSCVILTWLIWPPNRCNLKSSLKYWPPTAPPPPPLAYLKPSVRRLQKTSKRLSLAAWLLFHLFLLECINCTGSIHSEIYIFPFPKSQITSSFFNSLIKSLPTDNESRRAGTARPSTDVDTRVACVFCSWHHVWCIKTDDAFVGETLS